MLSKTDSSTAKQETPWKVQELHSGDQSGKVPTNVETQVHVHDLELFVTEQILDDTLAVQSLLKLCEQQGKTHEWTCQKPPLTQNGKRIRKTENFVPAGSQDSLQT